jgi:sialate O-acetylesterase
MRTVLSLAALLAVSAAPARDRALHAAGLRLHPLFSDNAVFQAGILVPIWGVADPGEEVTVSMLGQKKVVTAAADGKWRIRLDFLKTGGPYELSVSAKSGGSVTVKNILVGEVWLASGQSNMEWSVNASANAAEEKANAAHPEIRLFTVQRRQADAPQSDLAQTAAAGSWKICSPETVGGFSAVAYYFGREIHKRLGVPVGLIHSSWGGTPAEVWTRREVIDQTPELQDFVKFYAGRQANYEKQLEQHKAAVEKAKAEGKPEPRAPNAPMKLSCLYNGMIAPLVPYALRGAIWYQGESNAGNAKLYHTLFPAMIENWRQDWGQGRFPFLFVQLANYMARKEQPSESGWAELREAQLATLEKSDPAGMAVIIDIGDARDIHPKNKQDVGKRLALWALAETYDQKLVHSGPLYDSMKVEGNKARLSFKHVGGGLVARGEKLAGFALAGEDRKFVWADAKIEGDAVVVWSEAVPSPAAVRYGWADNPDCTLFNKEGLPASPFRTDRWPRPQQ